MIKEIYHRLDRRFGLGKYRFYKLFLNFFYPVHLAFSSRKTARNGSGIIVSLTSFPARIRRIHLVIESLLRQTLSPEAIVLYLSRDQFGDLSVLPRKLLKLYRKGLVDVRLEDGDIRSHKKYYYAFRDYADRTIITVDDDMIYPEDLVEVLVGASENKYVSCTVGAHMLVRDDALAEYASWERETAAGVPLYRIMPIGCGGVCSVIAHEFVHYLQWIHGRDMNDDKQIEEDAEYYGAGLWGQYITNKKDKHIRIDGTLSAWKTKQESGG